MNEHQKTYGIKDTFEKVLIGEIESLMKCPGGNYVKVILIAVGIEFLGACYDELPFEEVRKSDKRFNKGLKLLGKKYAKYTKESADPYFYDEVRCSFIHQFRPGKNIGITHRSEAKREKTKHLELVKDGSLILIIEDLFKDFKKACQKCIEDIDNMVKTNKKVSSEYLKLVDNKPEDTNE